MQGSVDMPGFQIGLLSKVIIKAPFEINEQTLESFPEDVIDYMLREYSEWTGDSKKKDD